MKYIATIITSLKPTDTEKTPRRTYVKVFDAKSYVIASIQAGNLGQEVFDFDERVISVKVNVRTYKENELLQVEGAGSGLLDYAFYAPYHDLMFSDKQDPCFNVRRSVLLATGEGWQVRVSTQGELRARWTDPKTGSEFKNYEIFERYLTDDSMVLKEQQAGRLVFENNNWYELELYDTSHPDETPRYVDILTDNVAYSYSEAYDRFMEYVEDPKWYDDLQSLLTQG